MVDLSDFILFDEQSYIQDTFISPWPTIVANLACCDIGNLSVNVEIEAILAVCSVIDSVSDISVILLLNLPRVPRLV